jgi:hypothetical protein
MKTQEFVQTINKLRLSNKNNWYAWQGKVNDRAVSLKGYNTWLQVFRVNELEACLPMEMSISDFKAELAKAVS